MSQSAISIVRYDIDFISNLCKKITTKLDEATMKKLMEIKINNRFVTESNPLILKYVMEKETANVWRNEKENNTQDGVTLFNETLNSNLNKITDANFGDIQSKILESIDKLGVIDSVYKESILDIIFNKSITQHTYAHLYSKLLVTLIAILGDDFKVDLLNKIKSFYKNNIEKEFSESSYDEICSGNKNKYKLLGNFIFMGELYINNIIDKVVILQYLEILFNCSFNSKDIDNVDRYIESLLNLIKTIGLKLENEIGEEFIGLVIDKLKTITANKDRFKSRLRFLVMDIIDLHKSKWIN
jgi:hypothetical protein